MYSTDEAYQHEQRERASQTIARVATQYKSQSHRIAELEWWRSIYQAYGDWQTAIDLLEEQMVAWGRKEHVENRELIEEFGQLLRQKSVAHTKGEWDEEDYTILGKARVYSEARYVVLFLPLDQAISTLEQTCQNILDELEGSECSKADALKLKATAAELSRVIDHLRK
jgi:hypothetical protein